MSDAPRFGRRKLLVASAGVATLAVGCDGVRERPVPVGNLVAPPYEPPEGDPPEPNGPQLPEETPSQGPSEADPVEAR